VLNQLPALVCGMQLGSFTREGALLGARNSLHT